MVYCGSDAVILRMIQPQLNLCAAHLHHLMFHVGACFQPDSADLTQWYRLLSFMVNGYATVMLWHFGASTTEALQNC